MKNQSRWQSSVENCEFAPLKGEITVDALIIGAGITGITTAVLLKEAGLRVAVVEQQGMGMGETGRTTAHLSYVTDARLHELCSKMGNHRAAAFWEAGELAMLQIQNLVEKFSLDCGLRVVPGYLFAATSDLAEESKTLAEDARLAREFGFDAEYLETAPVFGGPAVRFANQMKFHPLKYVYGLARTVPGDGSHVFTFTSGSEIDAKEHVLQTDQGSIRYTHLVAATHVPVQGERGFLSAGLFQTKLAAYSSYAIEAPIETMPESLFWDTGDPYTYYRIDQRDTECSIIIGGADHKTGQEDDTESCYDNLALKLRDKFPGAMPCHRWSGQVLETPDYLPYIGQIAERQYVATGFAGNGMTMGTFSAILIRDLISEQEHPWAEIFSPDRKAFSEALDYIRENKDFPAYFVKDHLKPAENEDDLARGSGALLKVDGKKRAVYCDAKGTRKVLSAVCPHMGCIVAWNEAESTWDCPCHGSRFTATGGLIAGPAESGLEEIQ